MLVFVGIFAGIIAGFLGLGGGILIVPAMMMFGFDMKHAIGISIMQMMASSFIGTIKNINLYKQYIPTGLLLGLGGVFGGISSGFILDLIPTWILESMFLLFILVSIVSIFKKPNQSQISIKKVHPLLLIIVGFGVGIIAMSLGIGGGLLLIPFLSLYMGYDLKACSFLMLFFLVFSSSFAFISLWDTGYIPYHEALLVSLGAIVGVVIGSYLKRIVKMNQYKTITLIVYSITFCLSFYKIVLQ